MKKLFILLVCCFALYVYKNQKDNYEYDYPKLIAQAAERSDWTTTARLSQRVLLEELNLDLRWDALQYTVLASKNLGDLTWTITALENSILDYTSQDKQEYIYTELMQAYYEKRNFFKARESALALLSLNALSAEKRADIEISHAEFSLAMSDFDTAESMLLSTLTRDDVNSSHTKATFMLASLYYYNNKLTSCKKYLENFLALPNKDPSKVGQALFIKADIAEMNENYEEANALYNEALDLHPNPDTINIRLKNLEKLISTSEVF